jgi:hypothetical protein
MSPGSIGNTWMLFQRHLIVPSLGGGADPAAMAMANGEVVW